MSDKQLEPIVPKDEDMAKSFNEVLKADKYIIITVTKDGDRGECSRIHQFKSLSETVEELEFWADILKGEDQANNELKAILKSKQIDNS